MMVFVKNEMVNDGYEHKGFINVLLKNDAPSINVSQPVLALKNVVAMETLIKMMTQ